MNSCGMTEFEEWAMSKHWWIDIYNGKDGFVYCREKGFTVEVEYDYLMELADKYNVKRPCVIIGG